MAKPGLLCCSYAVASWRYPFAGSVLTRSWALETELAPLPPRMLL